MSVLSDYMELLDNAHSTSEIMDAFDLNSNDQESIDKWDESVNKYVEAQRKLVYFIALHNCELSKQLTNFKSFV